MTDPITPRVAAELTGHEDIVLEAYLDSAKPPVWTWSIGITKASGVDPLQYKDKPAPLGVCLAAYVGLLRKAYAPAVLKAFKGRALTEAQFAAALSFHYSTGAIASTSWVALWLSGNIAAARAFLTSHYLNGGTLAERRAKEAALFFDGNWAGDGTAMVIPVSKPSYQPAFSKGKRVAITGALAAALGVSA